MYIYVYICIYIYILSEPKSESISSESWYEVMLSILSLDFHVLLNLY